MAGWGRVLDRAAVGLFRTSAVGRVARACSRREIPSHADVGLGQRVSPRIVGHRAVGGGVGGRQCIERWRHWRGTRVLVGVNPDGGTGRARVKAGSEGGSVGGGRTSRRRRMKRTAARPLFATRILRMLRLPPRLAM